MSVKVDLKSAEFCTHAKPKNPIYVYNRENKILFGKLQKRKKNRTLSKMKHINKKI